MTSELPWQHCSHQQVSNKAVMQGCMQLWPASALAQWPMLGVESLSGPKHLLACSVCPQHMRDHAVAFLKAGIPCSQLCRLRCIYPMRTAVTHCQLQAPAGLQPVSPAPAGACSGLSQGRCPP